MTDDTYQGWTNRETWATSLHLMSDQSFYNDVMEMVNNADDKYDLGRSLESYVDDLFDEFGDVDAVCMMQREIGSLWRVSWVELAESYWEDYRESED